MNIFIASVFAPPCSGPLSVPMALTMPLCMSEEVGRQKGETRWYEMSQILEGLLKREKGLNANVDFYSASLYYMLGIPIDLYTPIFAVSRISGWTAHVLEQHANNRLIRPRADYTGAMPDVPYVPIAER